MIKHQKRDHEEQITDYKTAAYIMPSEELIKEIRKYDSTHPKMDEIEFLNSLKKKYSQNDIAIFRRIREVRMLDKNNYFQGLE